MSAEPYANVASLDQAPGASSLSSRRGIAILLLLSLVQFMDILDASILNIALPSIKNDLGFSQQGLQWVIDGYILTYGGFLLLGGRMADLLGRRLVLVTGLVVFAGSSLTGGLAHSSSLLVGARFAQGLGAAMLSPAALSSLTSTFRSTRDRNTALGVWAAVSGIGGAAGVLFGGLLTEGPGWRWVLFVNVPVSAAILIFAPRLLDGTRRRAHLASFDVPGALLATCSLLLGVYALTQAPQVGWAAARTVAELAVAAALLAIFVANEARTARPLMPLRTFRLPGVAAANGVAALQFSAMIPVFFFLTLYMQQVLRYSPLQAGLAFLPLAVGVIAVTGRTARLIQRYGPKPTMIAGPVVFAAGLLYLSRLPADGTYLPNILPAILIVAVGAGAGLVSIINSATRGVPRADAGAAAGLVNTMQRIGTALGLAILSAFATARTSALAAAHSDRAHALTGGFDRAFLVAAGFATAAALLAAITARTRRVHEVIPVPAQAASAPVSSRA